MFSNLLAIGVLFVFIVCLAAAVIYLFNNSLRVFLKLPATKEQKESPEEIIAITDNNSPPTAPY